MRHRARMSLELYTVGLLVGAGAWWFLIEGAAAGMYLQTSWVFGPF